MVKGSYILRLIFAGTAVAFSAQPAATVAVSFFVDATRGNDASSGTSQLTPWRTLSQVNASTFSPGDCLFFKCGESWTGQLRPQGSGAPGQPIIVDKYGDGHKPVIDAQGATGDGVVCLNNQEYWEINNLDITNPADQMGDRRGISIKGSSRAAPIFRHIIIRKCDIHHIKGIAAESGERGKRTGGIIIESVNEGDSRTRFDEVFVEDCTISTVDNIGIALNSLLRASAQNREGIEAKAATPDGSKSEAYPYPGTDDWEARKFTRVTIRGNQIHDIAKNAIIVRFTDETCLIEQNRCWDTASRGKSGNTIFSRSCRGTVFQFNEGFLNHARGRDGSLYDADLQSPGCIFQYSYSHDNSQGLFWQCTDPRDSGIIVRFNISQNDRGIIFCLGYPASGTSIHDNIVFIGEHCSPTVISERRNTAEPLRYEFTRNVIYNLNPSTGYKWFNAARTIKGNVFFGFHSPDEPYDPCKVTKDPLMAAPGTGTIGLKSLAGYRLKPQSPLMEFGINKLINTMASENQ